MNKETGFFLSQKIGLVKDLDMGNTGDCLGSVRAKIEIDVSKPLE